MSTKRREGVAQLRAVSGEVFEGRAGRWIPVRQGDGVLGFGL